MIIRIVAIVCYKEYKLSNNKGYERIEIELKLLNSALCLRDRTLGNFAESIPYLPNDRKDNGKS